MKIKYYGTAAAEGVPGIFCECEICEKSRELGGKNIRTRTQALINDDLLIDFPADTYLHILRDNLKLHKIYHCIITHTHSDHFYPPELHVRARWKAHLKDQSPFNLYGTKEMVEKIEQHCSMPHIKGMIEDNTLTLNEIKPFEKFYVKDYKITPLKADHSGGAVIYLIEKDEKTLLWGHDTGYFPVKTIKYLEDNKIVLDFVSFDCCFGLKFARNGHMGFDTVKELRDDLKNKGIITDKTVCVVNHFSHNAGSLYEDMKNHSEKFGIITSYDGMEIEF